MKKSLIANSGIQFIEIDFTIEGDSFLKKKIAFAEVFDSDNTLTLVTPYFWNSENIYIVKDSLNEEAVNEKGDVIDDEILAEFADEIEQEAIYQISYADALSVFGDRWLPVPFLKQKGKEYGDGPIDWVRMYVSKKTAFDVSNYSLVLAFDTTLRDEWEDDDSDSLHDSDIQETFLFSCPKSRNDLEGFYAREWLLTWLEQAFSDSVFTKSTKKKHTEYVASYITLIDLLQEKKAFPEISVVSGQEKSIDISCVLDIGNSRTCGLLLETSSTNGGVSDFKKAQRLAIRDLSRPNHLHDQPFEMRLAFSQARFGNDGYKPSVSIETFSWPSLVRIGPEANRLIALNDSQRETPYYSSSPKRYLWDKTIREQSWKKVEIDTAGHLSSSDIFFGIAKHFSDKGKLIVKIAHPDGKDDKRINKQTIDYTGNGASVFKDELRFRIKQDEAAIGSTGDPVYPRSTLMTFVVFELLLQALSQINSCAYREKLGSENIPRRLKHLVLTCPTAMTDTDQRHFRNAADDAIDLLKMYFNDSFVDINLKLVPSPINTISDLERSEDWMYDEATCSHLAFLYSEITYRFNGDVKQYFKYCGKKNTNLNDSKQEVVTVASIDIGGGTTDVMLCSYKLDPQSQGSVVEPRPLFWEGFNLAGDDLLRRIIERAILPQIYSYAIKQGGDPIRAKAVMSDLFGPDTGEEFHVKNTRIKNLVTNQLLLPIAYAYIEFMVEGNQSDKLNFEALFYNQIRPNEELIARINEKFQPTLGFNQDGGHTFDIKQVQWFIDVEAINAIITQAIGELLRHISSIVAQYDCDVILLAGKPTKLPIIKELLIRNLSTFPDKIVTLGNYRIGNWYPFSDSHHNIKDPKTIVCVGAAISHLSELGALDVFRFNTEPLKQIKSRGYFIGKYLVNSAKINEEDVFFKKETQDCQLSLSNVNLLIGKRQFSTEQWRAAPIYHLQYKDSAAATRLKSRGLQPPYTFKLERSPMSIEELLIDGVVEDKSGTEFNFSEYFILYPQSMPEEFGYWLDTGCFTLDILDSISS